MQQNEMIQAYDYSFQVLECRRKVVIFVKNIRHIPGGDGTHI